MQNLWDVYFEWVIVKGRRGVLAFWAVIFIIACAVGTKFLESTETGAYSPPGSPSDTALQTFKYYFPDNYDSGSLVILVEYIGDANFNESVVSEWSYNYTQLLNDTYSQYEPKDIYISTVGYWTYAMVPELESLADNFISETGTFMFISIFYQSFSKEGFAFAHFVRDTYASLLPDDDYTLTITALELLYGDTTVQAEADFIRQDSISIPLALFVLAIFLRSLRLMLLPVLSLLLSMFVSFLLCLPVALSFRVAWFTPSIMVSIIIAMSMDYSLFLLTRFREEVSAGKETPAAVRSMLHSSGRVVLVSGLTLALTFIGTAIIPLDFIQSIAITCPIALLVCIAVALSLHPALLLTFPDFFREFSFSLTNCWSIPYRFCYRNCHCDCCDSPEYRECTALCCSCCADETSDREELERLDRPIILHRAFGHAGDDDGDTGGNTTGQDDELDEDGDRTKPPSGMSSAASSGPPSPRGLSPRGIKTARGGPASSSQPNSPSPRKRPRIRSGGGGGVGGGAGNARGGVGGDGRPESPRNRAHKSAPPSPSHNKSSSPPQAHRDRKRDRVNSGGGAIEMGSFRVRERDQSGDSKKTSEGRKSDDNGVGLGSSSFRRHMSGAGSMRAIKEERESLSAMEEKKRESPTHTHHVHAKSTEVKDGGGGGGGGGGAAVNDGSLYPINPNNKRGSEALSVILALEAQRQGSSSKEEKYADEDVNVHISNANLYGSMNGMNGSGANGRTAAFGAKRASVNANMKMENGAPVRESPSSANKPEGKENGREESEQGYLKRAYRGVKSRVAVYLIRKKSPQQSLWFRLPSYIASPFHALVMLIIILACALPVAVYVGQMDTTTDTNLVFPYTAPSQVAFNRIKQVFAPGVVEPYKVLVTAEPGEVFTSEFFYSVQQLTLELIFAGNGVTSRRVTSISSIQGLQVSYEEALSFLDANSPEYYNSTAMLYRMIVNDYVSADFSATIIQIQTSFEPEGDQAMAWIRSTRDLLDSFAFNETVSSQYGYHLYGGATFDVDSVDVVNRLLPVVIAVTVVVVFVVVAFIFSSVFVALRLLLTLGLSICWVYGLAVLAFQTNFLHNTWSALKDGAGIYWLIPAMTFSIMVGLGLDYDTMLLSRIREYRLQGFTTRASIIRGMYKTSGIVTGAGIIMAIAFGGLMNASTLLLDQFGFIMCTAVLMDTFVMRSLLVPGFIQLAGKVNWWPGKVPPEQFNEFYGLEEEERAELLEGVPDLTDPDGAEGMGPDGQPLPVSNNNDDSAFALIFKQIKAEYEKDSGELPETWMDENTTATLASQYASIASEGRGASASPGAPAVRSLSSASAHAGAAAAASSIVLGSGSLNANRPHSPSRKQQQLAHRVVGLVGAGGVGKPDNDNMHLYGDGSNVATPSSSVRAAPGSPLSIHIEEKSPSSLHQVSPTLSAAGSLNGKLSSVEMPTLIRTHSSSIKRQPPPPPPLDSPTRRILEIELQKPVTAADMIRPLSPRGTPEHKDAAGNDKQGPVKPSFRKGMFSTLMERQQLLLQSDGNVRQESVDTPILVHGLESASAALAAESSSAPPSDNATAQHKPKAVVVPDWNVPPLLRPLLSEDETKAGRVAPIPPPPQDNESLRTSTPARLIFADPSWQPIFPASAHSSSSAAALATLGAPTTPTRLKLNVEIQEDHETPILRVHMSPRLSIPRKEF